MRILQIVSYYYPHIGGIEQVAQDISESLKDTNDVKVVCFNHEKGNKIDNIDSVEVFRIGCFAKISSQSLSFSCYKNLKRVFKSFQPELVIFHYPNPFLAHYLLKMLKKYSLCKLVVYWHLDIVKQKLLGKLFEGQTKKLLKKAAKLISTSPNYIEGSRHLSKYQDKCEVVSCCVNAERLTVREQDILAANEIRRTNVNKTICFAMGRHVPYKGIEYLVRASKYLDENIKIYIGGEGELTSSLKALAKGDDKITFLGRLDMPTLRAYLLASDIFCFPSITKNEAFGIALAEAMYFGKPAVTFTIEGSGVNYVSLNGVTGIEVENKNVRKYAEAIKQLAMSRDLCESYGKSAKERVNKLFTEDIFKERINKVILAMSN